jgi:hypothetical protein
MSREDSLGRNSSSSSSSSSLISGSFSTSFASSLTSSCGTTGEVSASEVGEGAARVPRGDACGTIFAGFV